MDESERPMSWIIEIKGWRPWYLNELLAVHRMVASGMKKEDAQELWIARLQCGIPIARGQRRVRLTIHDSFRGGLPDSDAPLKSFLDGCKRSRLIVDDADESCLWEKPRFVKTKDGLKSVVELEDMPCGSGSDA